MSRGERTLFLKAQLRQVLGQYDLSDQDLRKAVDEIAAVVPPPETVGELAQAALSVVFGWEDRPGALDEALIYEAGAEPLISYGDLRELVRATRAYMKRVPAITH